MCTELVQTGLRLRFDVMSVNSLSAHMVLGSPKILRSYTLVTCIDGHKYLQLYL